jgi:hypothetical protein
MHTVREWQTVFIESYSGIMAFSGSQEVARGLEQNLHAMALWTL